MKRSLSILTGLACLLALALLPSCSSSVASDAAKLEWPMKGVSEIRAYRTNWADEFGQELILTEKGELNANRIPQKGIALNEKQMAKLNQVITGKHPDQPSAGCFNPHHAFVFFDSDGNMVGRIDICFKCGNYDSSHRGFSSSLDFDGLAKLLGELEIPIANPEW